MLADKFIFFVNFFNFSHFFLTKSRHPQISRDESVILDSDGRGGGLGDECDCVGSSKTDVCSVGGGQRRLVRAWQLQ